MRRRVFIVFSGGTIMFQFLGIVLRKRVRRECGAIARYHANYGTPG